MPDSAELAMMAESDGTGTEACLCCAFAAVGRRSGRGELLCSVCRPWLACGRLHR